MTPIWEDIRSKLTYANVMATIAVFLALGGGAFAVAALKRNSVGSKQLAAGAVRTPDIARQAVTAKKIADDSVGGTKIDEASLGQVPSAADAETLGGNAASAFAPATVIRTATVNSDGTVEAGLSDGITSANLSRESTGRYCVDGLSPAPRGIAATLVASTSSSDDLIAAELAPVGICAGAQASVQTSDGNPVTGVADRAFLILVH